MRGLLLGLAVLLLAPAAASAQLPRSLAVDLPDGGGATLPVEHHRGYPAVPGEALAPLGWRVERGAGPEVRLLHGAGLELRFQPGSPFMRWDGELVQLVHAPYWLGDSFHLPLQLVVDLFPGLLPHAYQYDAARAVLEVAGGAARPQPGAPPAGGGPGEAGGTAAAAPAGGAPAVGGTGAAAPPAGPEGPRRPRVVIIDPGHGGDDPGAIGPSGVREKDVALAIALALARELASRPDIEVRLTRDRDVEVPLWSRGEWATEWKGDRPGVFLSIHANALPDRPGVRGFETYFLSEARDEHERRVAAIENAPLREGGVAGGGAPGASDPLLDAILRDLRAFDHQHWSADLAEEVQRELSRFHPGTDRGVKQGPFAVITNSLMPSVLVEIGFLTNPEEERLLARPEFHRDTAQALARAVVAFFGRYPPGGVE